MRIESGLSSYSYQSRHVPGSAVVDDTSSETATTTSGRATGASTFSSTLLSNQLASALWTVDSGRKTSVQINGASTGSDDASESARLQMVEAAYREYEVPTVYDEF